MAVDEDPAMIYDALDGNDNVTLPNKSAYQITTEVRWNPAKVFHGGAGDDTIWGGDGNDNIDPGEGNNVIRGDEDFAGGRDRDTVHLRGGPSDYILDDRGVDWTTTIDRVTGERNYISADVEHISFTAFGNNERKVTNVFHELAHMAVASYKDEPLVGEGWRPVLAQELGISPLATDTREYSTRYEMRDGVYHTYGKSGADPFAVVAHVYYALVNGMPTLAVAFRGTDDLEKPANLYDDIGEWISISEYYERFRPLVDALKSYVKEMQVPRIYVTGHSLGGSMAQEFMQEAGVFGDDRYYGMTFGSPGAPNQRDDPRMFHLEHTDDIVPAMRKMAQGLIEKVDPYQALAGLDIFKEVAAYGTSGTVLRKSIPGGKPTSRDEHDKLLYEKTALLLRSEISGKETASTTFVDGELVQDAHHYASQIHRFYQSALDRLPDMDGLVNWTGALKAGMTLKQAAGRFADSTEFRLHYGAPDDAGFVKQLYLNVLDREADAGGLSNWTKAMSAGMTRAEALVGFSESVENIQRMAPVLEDGIWVRDNTAATVARLYDSVFDRLPDAGGLGAWTDAIKAGMGLDQAADGFTGSAEFQQRYGALDNTNFVKTLYRNVLDREAEPAGLANWRGALDAGVDRSDIVLAFSESAEHVMKLAPRIDDGIWLL
ncbi:hypothetical protein N825_32675 [Skermanella stibiiresistens SB22]|uniref:DUF4214 domain-containing protein n=2 Tax=Skermanella TaxID=204447 RepID=W9GTV2_9PROT|nr:hypothetical protein N825_32675 [Skermanella stibiiresistens SB22]